MREGLCYSKKLKLLKKWQTAKKVSQRLKLYFKHTVTFVVSGLFYKMMKPLCVYNTLNNLPYWPAAAATVMLQPLIVLTVA